MATVLQKYFERGWLKFGDASITPQDRLNAGNRLYADFYKAGIVDLRIPDLSKPRVDGGNAKGTSDFVLDARERFNKAILALNPEQSYVIWQVVCLDKPINLPQNALYRHDIEVVKEEVCRGLDALFYHYWGKIKPARRHRILAMVSQEAKEGLARWIGKLTN